MGTRYITYEEYLLKIAGMKFELLNLKSRIHKFWFRSMSSKLLSVNAALVVVVFFFHSQSQSLRIQV